jgi:transcriptional regulator with XRE-family HTH domain
MDAATLLRSARHRAGLSLRELALRAGTSHATLSAYEHGTKVPTVDTFARVLEAAGFTVDPELTRRVVVDPRTGLDRGDELAAVLELAEQFPARHTPTLQAPVFGRA